MQLYDIKYIKYTYFFNKYMQKEELILVQKKLYTFLNVCLKIGTLLQNTQLLNMKKIYISNFLIFCGSYS